LLGFDGGVLKDQVDEYLWLPTEKGAYGLVESAHALFCHILTDCLLRESLRLTGSEEKKHAYSS
jgi:D-sedoheptulose 7-phosphate isomerase